MARRRLDVILSEWALEEFRDDAALVASELVTNSVAETGKVAWGRRPPVGLRLHGGPSVLAMEVWDAVLGAPVARAAAAGDESGRGLAIVAGLSTRCGFYYPGKRGGKVTWAIIGRPAWPAGKPERLDLRTLLLAFRACRLGPSQANGGR